MKQYDMRFNESIFKQFIGKHFEKYCCDRFEYTNSVTQIVGFYIDGKTYKMTNIQEAVDYYGTSDDMAVCKFSECKGSEIQSAFVEGEIVDTPVDGTIQRIKLINENQKVSKDGIQTYDVWLTRGVIFEVNGREIAFEKDIVPFSEEIIIKKGYDLIDTFGDVKEFSEDWDDGIVAIATRKIITIE